MNSLATALNRSCSLSVRGIVPRLGLSCYAAPTTAVRPSAATARALLRTRRFAKARASSGAVCARDPAPALIAASAWPFVRNRRADPPALAAALGDFSRGLPLGDTRGEARGEAFFFLPSDAACLDARSLDLAPLSGGTRTGVIGVRERAGLLCQIDRWLGSVEIAAPNRCPTQRHRCQNESS